MTSQSIAKFREAHEFQRGSDHSHVLRNMVQKHFADQVSEPHLPSLLSEYHSTCDVFVIRTALVPIASSDSRGYKQQDSDNHYQVLTVKVDSLIRNFLGLRAVPEIDSGI